MSSSDSTAPLPNASQTYAWQALGPDFVGWILQLMISGMCIQQSFQFFSSKTTISKHMKRTLAAALLFNSMTCATVISEVLLWGTAQQRDEASLWNFKIPDSLNPIPGGLTGFVVQCFFAERAWRICNKSMIFLVGIGLCIGACIAGSTGLGILQLVYPSSYDYISILFLLEELWTWSAALVDIVNSAVIIIALTRKQTGYDMPTDGIVSKIIFATMESASMTTILAVLGAVLGIAFWSNENIAPNVIFLYPLPAVYTLSLLWCLQSTDHVRKQQQAYSNSASTFVNNQFVSNSDSNTSNVTGGCAGKEMYLGSVALDTQSPLFHARLDSDLLTKDGQDIDMVGITRVEDCGQEPMMANQKDLVVVKELEDQPGWEWR